MYTYTFALSATPWLYPRFPVSSRSNVHRLTIYSMTGHNVSDYIYLQCDLARTFLYDVELVRGKFKTVVVVAGAGAIVVCNCTPFAHLCVNGTAICTPVDPHAPHADLCT